MKRRSSIALLLLATLVIGLVLWPAQPPLGPEPTFKGQPLTFWLKECDKDFIGTTKELGPGEGRNTVRQIGTNALPFLLRMASASTYDLRWQATKLLGGHVHIRDHAEERAHALAWTGFAALGEIAKPAVPGLAKFLVDRRWNIRKSAATSLSYIGPSAEDAVPSLIQTLKDKNHDVRYCAAVALGRIHTEPQLVVPALICLLDTPDSCVAMEALMEFGDQAKTAVPTLHQLSGSADRTTRWWASQTLQRIDPLAVVKAEAK
jgi:HEAT repeat protein